MDKVLVLYTMKGCPWCDLMKKKLREENIKFVNRDIEKYQQEYDTFVKVTKSELIPAFMIIEVVDDEQTPRIYVPEKDFNDIDQGVSIIKEHFKK